MHSVLVIVEKVLSNDIVTQSLNNRSWQNLIGQVAELVGNSGENEKFPEGVWLIDLTNGMSMFSSIVHKIESYQLTYRVLFFEESPKWVYSQNQPNNVGTRP